MNPTDAEEYTQALGQVASGAWRQVALGHRLGVPQALGLTTEQWVESRLGGYQRLTITDRREAVVELTSPVEEGGMGLSGRQTAAVLGVHSSTIDSDRRAGNPAELAPSNGSDQAKALPTAGNPAPAHDPDWVALQWLGNLRNYCQSLAEGLKEEERIRRGLAAGGKLPSVRTAKAIVASLERLSDDH